MSQPPRCGEQPFLWLLGQLKKIDNHLRPADTGKRLSSIALHGLGGVGSTQIALAHAYSKVEELDAVLGSLHKISSRFHKVSAALQLMRCSSQTHTLSHTRKTWSSFCFGCRRRVRRKGPQTCKNIAY